MNRLLDNRWFALFELFLACIVGFAWYFQPSLDALPLLVVLLPWSLRMLSGRSPFLRTSLDALLLLFLATAVIGLWSAYDRTEAEAKFWVILSALFFFYAIARQPSKNLWAVALFFSFIGFSLATYFALSHDWTAFPAKIAVIDRIGRWWMTVRPTLSIGSVHPNGAAGMMALMLPLSLAIVIRNWRLQRYHQLAWTVPMLGVTLAGLLLTSSRGALLATALAAGIWIAWRTNERISVRRHIFTKLSLILILLSVIVFLLLAGWLDDRSMLMESALDLSANSSLASRLQLVRRTLHLIAEVPYTGGGLGAFPGLYSQYILTIPFFVQIYSHNLLLNIALEQGLLALVVFVGIVVYTLRLLLKPSDQEAELARNHDLIRQATVATIVTALAHGMVSDTLYGVRGTPLLFFWAGVAAAVAKPQIQPELKGERWTVSFRYNRMSLGHVLTRVGLVAIGLILISMPFWRVLGATWYANLGAVEMARTELREFPTNRWEYGDNVEHLLPASELFVRALSLDPGNATAHYRLGFIAMIRRDYETAVHHLELAHQGRPTHRGIAKTLGYGYLWSGDLENAQLLLVRFAEIKGELDAYISYWRNLKREDLRWVAIQMKDRLAAQPGS